MSLHVKKSMGEHMQRLLKTCKKQKRMIEKHSQALEWWGETSKELECLKIAHAKVTKELQDIKRMHPAELQDISKKLKAHEKEPEPVQICFTWFHNSIAHRHDSEDFEVHSGLKVYLNIYLVLVLFQGLC
eukprot:m.121332 g.121332  ORF g.121332 m.121332 type:complete len:130 (+) comp37750_c0_seq10:549-938(+)